MENKIKLGNNKLTLWKKKKKEGDHDLLVLCNRIHYHLEQTKKD